MLIKTLTKPSSHGFTVCVIFDVEIDANGELVIKNKRFVVIGPDGSIYIPEENTFEAAVAMLADRERKEEVKEEESVIVPHN
jgi:hypothetical protein